MSEFQNRITDIVIRAIAKWPYINAEKSTYTTEHKVPIGHTYGRQDIFINLVDRFESSPERKVCIEIKSGVEDLHSGYGLNFTEDFNFLVFEAGHGYSAIRTKHLKDLPEHIGICFVQNGNIYCLREATLPPVSGWSPTLYRSMGLSLGLGRTAQEYMEDSINCA